MILALYYIFSFILDRNLAKANCTENQVCASCDIVVLDFALNGLFTDYLSEIGGVIYKFLLIIRYLIGI